MTKKRLKRQTREELKAIDRAYRRYIASRKALASAEKQSALALHTFLARARTAAKKLRRHSGRRAVRAELKALVPNVRSGDLNHLVIAASSEFDPKTISRYAKVLRAIERAKPHSERTVTFISRSGGLAGVLRTRTAGRKRAARGKVQSS